MEADIRRAREKQEEKKPVQGRLRFSSFNEFNCLNAQAIRAVQECGGNIEEMAEEFHFDIMGVADHLDDCRACRRDAHLDK